MNKQNVEVAKTSFSFPISLLPQLIQRIQISGRALKKKSKFLPNHCTERKMQNTYWTFLDLDFLTDSFSNLQIDNSSQFYTFRNENKMCVLPKLAGSIFLYYVYSKYFQIPRKAFKLHFEEIQMLQSNQFNLSIPPFEKIK